MNPNVSSLGSSSAVGKRRKIYQISKGGNKSASEASLAVVWEGEWVAPSFTSFFVFLSHLEA